MKRFPVTVPFQTSIGILKLILEKFLIARLTTCEYITNHAITSFSKTKSDTNTSQHAMHSNHTRNIIQDRCTSVDDQSRLAQPQLLAENWMTRVKLVSKRKKPTLHNSGLQLVWDHRKATLIIHQSRAFHFVR